MFQQNYVSMNNFLKLWWVEEILHHQKDGWNPNKIMG